MGGLQWAFMSPGAVGSTGFEKIEGGHGETANRSHLKSHARTGNSVGPVHEAAQR